ncbi:MAG TPA: putative Na+/H+ antiporter [Verrucomicrobiae bacterium]|nr:putative Na+/H+ antiporter [Verrucomicrobiae bacterium]
MGYKDWIRHRGDWKMVLLLCCAACLSSVAATPEGAATFPPLLSDYHDPAGATLFETFRGRVAAEPFNLVATIIFFLAILHTFLAPKFTRLSHRLKHAHEQALASQGRVITGEAGRAQVSFWAEAFHFLGEIEAVFGIWVIPLLIALTIEKGWPVARDYIGQGLDFTEPLFVVIIMTIAASRPVLKITEQLLGLGATVGGNSIGAWWFTILTLGPLLGSLITEPAAMTISALLLAQKFYHCKPSRKLAYATLGLLFVNISVGGTLTHFAAPPVLMVATKWGWGLFHMLQHFGWKAVLGILAANAIYFAYFMRELRLLDKQQPDGQNQTAPSVSNSGPPAWVTAIHIFFLVWTVVTSHYPALFIGGFLFYLAFLQATEQHQYELELRPALLVGFFLAGLVVHGGLQGWWIGPVLRGLTEVPLFAVAGILTAFNDNAAITYLASLVPNLADSLKYAVVAGAVTGGGLTVIANAPNPAGQAILGKFFPDGVAPLGLLLGALFPTLLIALIFLIV